MATRTGFLIPFLAKLLPRLLEWTPLELIKRRIPDKQGYLTDGYVLASVAVFTMWLLLLEEPSSLFSSSAARWIATVFLAWHVWGLGLFLLKWLFVDRKSPDEKRAVLLFLLNLVELRLILCITAVLVGHLPAEDRWLLFRGTLESSTVPWPIHLPYQLLMWLLIGLAIGALAGALRTSKSDNAVT